MCCFGKADKKLLFLGYVKEKAFMYTSMCVRLGLWVGRKGNL